MRRCRPSPRELAVVIPVVIAVVAASVTGCEGTVDRSRDFSNHAVIRGDVMRADSTPLANGSVFISCGTDAPGDYHDATTTNADGDFSRTVKLPDQVELGGGNLAVCAVSAGPVGGPFIASDTILAAFSPVTDDAPFNTLHLVEPPSPSP